MKKVNKFENRMDKMLSESINKKPVPKRTVLKEGKFNTEILDFIDTAHKLFNKLKSDKSVDKSAVKHLFTDFGPIVGSLHGILSMDSKK